MTQAKIPAKAVGLEDTDLVAPTTAVLQSLSLLPSDADLKKGGEPLAAFTGPPASVAVIEAGATAASKWWSTAIAGGSAISTVAIGSSWTSLGAANQPFALICIGVVLAAAALGIAYLLGSDVRGRAAATVATIQARQAVATAFIEAARQSAGPNPGPRSDAVVFAMSRLGVKNGTKHGKDEDGWHAIAGRLDSDDTSFLLMKDDQTEWVSSKDVVLG